MLLLGVSITDATVYHYRGLCESLFFFFFFQFPYIQSLDMVPCSNDIDYGWVGRSNEETLDMVPHDINYEETLLTHYLLLKFE